MAESKGALIAKSVQKHAGRAKEKLLQNLGKVDRTADDIFDEHLQNFTRQQNAANRLQKEFNNYIRCIRAVQTASKTLMDSLCEIYESGWTGHDLLYVQAQNIEMLWQDFSHKLGDQVLIPLNTYQSQFPEMRKKIDKRGRKLVDFDGQRHSYQSLQANAGSGSKKSRDETKISKARESLEEAKRTYDMLNSELHDELPALYDSRALFLVTNLQTLFAAEQLFHSETAKVYAELEAVVDKLANECQRGSLTLKKNNITSSKSPVITSTLNSSTTSPSSPIAGSTPSPLDNVSSTTTNSQPSSTVPVAPVAPVTAQVNGNAKPDSSNSSSNSPAPSSPTATSPTPTSPASPTPTSNQNTTNANNSNSNSNSNPSAKPQQDMYDIPAGATTDNLPPGVLYRVKATYKYTREDVDELSFEVGEIIRVVEYDDPEEQEEGWLMGVKEATGEKGMFPANFTRPL